MVETVEKNQEEKGPAGWEIPAKNQTEFVFITELVLSRRGAVLVHPEAY